MAMSAVFSRVRPALLLAGLRRLGSVAITLLGLLALTFAIGRVMPVDPVLSIVGPDADRSTYEQVRAQLGLDQPLSEQFTRYLGELSQGDLGKALLSGNPVSEDIARVFPATVELATLAIVIGTALGVPLGGLIGGAGMAGVTLVLGLGGMVLTEWALRSRLPQAPAAVATR